MRKKGRSKYFLLAFLCFSMFIYGFFAINITKDEDVRKKSKFTIDLKLKPVDLRIETKKYVFYANNKIIYDVKEKYMEIYHEILSR
ncbi:hypothetical protein LGK97_03205 [Clostridium sp. CS001]|uniref:hypothetical protein n=1 Tax=Clostridium sp. CS001 TaxID=2880648 RepID=UPI001CF35869|nr:hypothetical protein [Clostridium sp. CS001]MCB2288769.1 hypothetical protein [Clostridium sp. CS001]